MQIFVGRHFCFFKLVMILLFGLEIQAMTRKESSRKRKTTDVGTELSVPADDSGVGASQLKKMSGVSAHSDELKDLAERQGFGYKYANLSKLSDKCASLSVSGITVKIPEFCGIPSSVMINQLNAVGFDIQHEWGSVVAIMKEHAMTATNFTQDFIEARNQFEIKLRAAFDRWIERGLPSTDSVSCTTEFSLLNAFIQSVLVRDGRLMVRSTGKEDTLENSNAGAYKSIANVGPTIREVLSAIAQVIISYFSLESLVLRLAANDRTIFAGEVFIPVFVQEMIGEAVTEIPCSGVMFTQDPESCARNIVFIQTSWGHNEGVVNSTVAVDTFYVVKQASGLVQVFPAIRRKSTRLVPRSDAHGLQRVVNEQALALTSTLNEDVVIALGDVGTQLEAFYGYPLDIEFVIKGNVLYIVQARPIVVKASTEKPSFIRDGAVVSDKNFNGISIVTAGGSVREVFRPEQILCGRTLDDIMCQYQAVDFNREALVAVVVGEQVASSAHFAVVLRGGGKPLLYSKDWRAIQTAATSGTEKLMIDVQRGRVWVVPQTTVVDVVEGWYKYPMKANFSVFPARTSDGGCEAASSIDFKPGEAEAFLEGLVPGEISLDFCVSTPSEAIESRVFHAALCVKKTLDKIFAAYRHIISIEGALAADIIRVQSEVSRIISCITDGLGLPSSVDDVEVAGDAGNLWLALSELNSCIVQSDLGGSRHMELLFYSQALVSLFEQDTADTVVQQSCSVKKLLSNLKLERELHQLCIDNEIDPKYQAVFRRLIRVREVGVTPELKERWTSFLSIFPITKSMQNLSTFIQRLENLGVLSVWFNTECANIIPEDKADHGVFLFKNLEKSLGNSDQEDFFKMLLFKKNLMKEISTDAFSSPAKFEEAFCLLEGELINYFMSGEFYSDFSRVSRFGQAIAFEALYDIVQLLDASIKAMKGCESMPDRPNKFQRMLVQFKGLLDLISRIKKNCERDEKSAKTDYVVGLVDRILRKATFTDADLESTAGFDVRAWLVASPSHDAVLPVSLEDAYTMMHQGALALLYSLTRGSFYAAPPLLAHVASKIEEYKDISHYKVAPSVTRSFDYGRVIDNYHLPLGAHSCDFSVVYDSIKNNTELSVKFQGEGSSGANRTMWSQVAGMGVLFNLAYGREIFDHIEITGAHGTLGLTIKVVISVEDELSEDVFKMIRSMLRYTQSPFSFKQDDYAPLVHMILSQSLGYEDALAAFKKVIGSDNFKASFGASQGDIFWCCKWLEYLWNQEQIRKDSSV